jgi:hypothetical protein
MAIKSSRASIGFLAGVGAIVVAFATLLPPAKAAPIGDNGTGSSVVASTAVQCSGTTKKGERCKRMTKNASGRCYQH